jgi:hypothetical protein
MSDADHLRGMAGKDQPLFAGCGIPDANGAVCFSGSDPQSVGPDVTGSATVTWEMAEVLDYFAACEVLQTPTGPGHGLEWHILRETYLLPGSQS